MDSFTDKNMNLLSISYRTQYAAVKYLTQISTTKSQKSPSNYLSLTTFYRWEILSSDLLWNIEISTSLAGCFLNFFDNNLQFHISLFLTQMHTLGLSLKQTNKNK